MTMMGNIMLLKNITKIIRNSNIQTKIRIKIETT